MKKLLSLLVIWQMLSVPLYASGEDSHADADIAALKAEMQTMQKNFLTMQKQYQSMMANMQKRIVELEGRSSKPVTSDASSTRIWELESKVDKLERSSQAPSLQKTLSQFNPEISVIGDLIYKATDEDGGEGDNDFNLREVEITFSSNVDTYARADFFVAIENEDGETEIAVEEGYLTLLETPIPNLQGKFGKFRPYFGKANRYHLHAMPWVDYPKFVQNFFGEEGFSEAGVSLNYLIPNPWDVYSELTVEGFNNGDTVLGGGEEGDTMYLAHLKNFFELNNTTTLELGASHMFGENGLTGSAKSHVTGGDVTLKWITDEPGEYTAITSQTEFLYNDREVPDASDIDSWGMYSSLEFRPFKKWTLFGRYDYSEKPADESDKLDAYTAGITFAQSENAFWRIQYTHTDNDLSEDTNEVWLQLDFGIGPHRAHSH